MRRNIMSLCVARPAAVLLAILFICLCSLMLSVYYVHNVRIASPLELMQQNKVWVQSAKIIKDDDSKDSGSKVKLTQNLSEGVVDSGLPILNNIDIAYHVEMNKAIEQQQQKLQQNNVKNRHMLNRNEKYPRMIKKEDMWPSKKKVYSHRNLQDLASVQLSNNPLRTRKNWNMERYIVYLCNENLTCAGWGDRQHGVFSSYMISLVTNRTFKVQMETPCPIQKLYHPRILNWKVNESEFEGLSNTHVFAMNNPIFRDDMKVIDFNKIYPHDVVYLTTNYDYFYNLKSNPNYKQIFQQKVRGRPRPILFADLWQSVFKMNKRVIRKVTPALQNAWPTKHHKLACAHIRFGRNPSIPSDGDIRNNMTTITPLWGFLKKYSDPAKFRLFVASDWKEFRERVIAKYKSVSVDVEGDIMHIDKVFKHNKKNNSSMQKQDTCNGFEKVIADQHVLSKCDILLLTYSVFGKAAAYLRRSNENLYLMDKGTVKPLILFNDKHK